MIIPALAVASSTFDDVSDGNIFHDDIAWLDANDITDGCNPAQGNTNFCPEDFVTREQMAKFLHRLVLNVGVEGPPGADGGVSGYEIVAGTGSGVVSGENTVTAVCPGDKVAVGGGHVLSEIEDIHQLVITESYPTADDTWTVTADSNGKDYALGAYVICVTPAA